MMKNGIFLKQFMIKELPFCSSALFTHFSKTQLGAYSWFI